MFDRIVAMLPKLGRRGYTVGEEGMEYREVKTDPDSDTDANPEQQIRTPQILGNLISNS